MNSNKKTARIAGFLYLFVIVFGIFAEVVRNKIFVPEDAVTTISNIQESELLFRFGFVSDLIMLTCFVLLPLALYKLLKGINKNQALLMVILALVAAPIAMINLLNNLAPLLLVKGDSYQAIYGADQL
ncbi:MAG: DUF4386 domain-containing protein, partial [Mariniphaga sp.]|nr:DUF4386 domain-containing protein [Mariniphaga sp.]